MKKYKQEVEQYVRKYVEKPFRKSAEINLQRLVNKVYLAGGDYRNKQDEDTSIKIANNLSIADIQDIKKYL